MKADLISNLSPLSLNEFYEILDADLEPDNSASIWAMREPLSRLSLDLSWIYPALESVIQDDSPHGINSRQPSYYVLRETEKYRFRLNIWLPETSNTRQSELEGAAYSYYYPHDHNFDILSINCLGGGYETHLFEYVSDYRPNTSGEAIDVRYNGRRRQKPMEVFFYEKNKDIHIQIPTTEVSVTLNLLPYVTSDFLATQHIYVPEKTDRLRFVGRPPSPENRLLSSMFFAAKIKSIYDAEMSYKDFFENMSETNRPAIDAQIRKLVELQHKTAHDKHKYFEDEVMQAGKNIKYFEIADEVRRWSECL